MKFNKKGTSLAELIVSVALISVVMIFMFRLLLDLNNEQVNNDFAIDNQIIRAEIIRMIENDLNDKKIFEINDVSSEGEMKIQFHYTDGTAEIVAKKESFKFTDSKGETRKWTFNENCEFFVDKANVYVKQDENIYSMIISLEIHTQNDNNTVGNNNSLDDITLSYIGYTNDYKDANPLSLSCLGYACQTNTYTTLNDSSL